MRLARFMITAATAFALASFAFASSADADSSAGRAWVSDDEVDATPLAPPAPAEPGVVDEFANDHELRYKYQRANETLSLQARYNYYRARDMKASDLATEAPGFCMVGEDPDDCLKRFRFEAQLALSRTRTQILRNTASQDHLLKPGERRRDDRQAGASVTIDARDAEGRARSRGAVYSAQVTSPPSLEAIQKYHDINAQALAKRLALVKPEAAIPPEPRPEEFVKFEERQVYPGYEDSEKIQVAAMNPDGTPMLDQAAYQRALQIWKNTYQPTTAASGGTPLAQRKWRPSALRKGAFESYVQSKSHAKTVAAYEKARQDVIHAANSLLKAKEFPTVATPPRKPAAAPSPKPTPAKAQVSVVTTQDAGAAPAADQGDAPRLPTSKSAAGAMLKAGALKGAAAQQKTEVDAVLPTAERRNAYIVLNPAQLNAEIKDLNPKDASGKDDPARDIAVEPAPAAQQKP